MPTLKVINLREHPKIRTTIAKALETQKKRTTPKTLTRKDVLIANILRRQSNRRRTDSAWSLNDGVVVAAHAIADALKRDNPRFDHRRFISIFRRGE